MVELMAAKFAELWRRRMMERPRDDAQLKPRLTAAGKRKPAVRGFPISAAFTNGKYGGDPKVLAGTSNGGPASPIATAATPRAAMPAKPATASHLRDERLLLHRKNRGRERPCIEGNKRDHTAGRYSGWF